MKSYLVIGLSLLFCATASAQESSSYMLDILRINMESEAAERNSQKTQGANASIGEVIEAIFETMETPEITTHSQSASATCESDQDCTIVVADAITSQIVSFTDIPNLFPDTYTSVDELKPVVFFIVHYKVKNPEMNFEESFEKIFPKMISPEFKPEDYMESVRSINPPDPGKQ